MGGKRGGYHVRNRKWAGRVVTEYIGGGESGRLADDRDAQRS